MEKFQVGVTVRLKSGGPKMTVYDSTNDSNIATVWFDKEGIVKYGTFISACLFED